MQLILYTITKIVTKICSSITNSWVTILLRYNLWINGVEVGNCIKAINTTPLFWKQKGGNGVVKIGYNVTFISYGDQSYNSRCKIMVENNANLIIGHDTGFNGVLIYCQDGITIGNYVKVGGGARIFDTDHHPIDWQERRKLGNGQKSNRAPIVIEDDVFIGAGCYIMKGVTIGARSIIAAGSVVVKSIPSDEIWGGNPARFIKKLK